MAEPEYHPPGSCGACAEPPAPGIPFGITEPLSAGMDLPRAVAAEGGSLVLTGIHADGTRCFHGLAAGQPEVSGGLRWAACSGAQQVTTGTTEGEPQPARDGWELVPNRCPSCGASDAVVVREAAGAEPSAALWDYFCTVCADRGTGRPKQAR